MTLSTFFPEPRRKKPNAYRQAYEALRDWGTVAGPEEEHRAELERCKADRAYWVNAYCKTYDPRTPGKELPFTLWPKQEAFLAWIGERAAKKQGGVCAKARDGGISFVCCADALHDFLFLPGSKTGFGSRKLEYVDDLGNPDSLFEKIRFMLRRLPDWMLPRGWKAGKHDCHTRFVNPATGATITGEGGDEIGRGGRCGKYFLDEHAFLEHPDRVEQALVATTDVLIRVSTPNGPGNAFYRLRHSLPAEQVFEFHWRDDPRKDDAWHAKKLVEVGPTVFAAEYDIDFSASIEGICIPGAWVRSAVREEQGVAATGAQTANNGTATGNGSATVPANGRLVAGFDIGEEGDNLSVFLPRTGGYVGLPVSWGKSNTTETAWRGRDEAKRLGAAEVYYDSVGVGAGIKGTWDTAEIWQVPFRKVPINTGASPTENVWPDGETSQQKFANLKAELWWCLRLRFERTYEHVTGKATHRPEDMISLPDHPQLVAQLSTVLYRRTETGKVRIESKDELARRGIKSPDFAEALVLSEAATVCRLKEFWLL